MTPWLRGAGVVLVGAVAVVLGARFSVAMPGTPVPQSAQTLAVLLVGGLLGPVRGPASVVIYLIAGACGLPVFAGGASGLGVLSGPSAGYLLGFVVAAWWMGRGRDWAARYSQWVLAGVVAHAAVLLFGWAGLAVSMGGLRAIEAGVAPFLVGGLWKSLGAGMILAARDRALRRHRDDG